ncbi:PQQ-binding-like beta-propeller repeat protein [Streptomyces sp. NPDC005907]|uniref:outer membrane protein assembly factor BamB family protein n=1 Tax=Streptomyces sp. NPDC005907 TaxID=3154571 RepID=UPI0033D40305
MRAVDEEIRRAARRPRGAGAVTGLALALGLLAGCGSGDATGEPADKGAASGGSAGSGGAAPAGPAYKGPRLPGLAERAAWSLPAAEGGSAPGLLDLGETFVFAKDADGAYVTDFDAAGEPERGKDLVLHMSDEPESLVLEFRDAKTGGVRRTMKVKSDSVTATTWHDGVPALAVGTSGTTESDGLTEETVTSTATLYDATGKKLGTSELPQDVNRMVGQSTYPAVVLLEGYRVGAADNTLSLTPVDGGETRTVDCTGSQADCAFLPETGEATGASAFAPLITGKYYAGFENASDFQYEPEQVTLSDLATGRKVWSSADVEPPRGVKFTDDGDRMSEGVRVLRVSDGKVLTAWQTAAGSDVWIDAWYELGGGAEAGASYPTVREPLFAPSGNLVAAATDEGVVVREAATGRQLWAQGAGEKPLTPLRFSADDSVLYGTTGDDTVVAVDARTKEVLAKSLPADHVPLFDDASRYGYLGTEDGFFVFAPAS